MVNIATNLLVRDAENKTCILFSLFICTTDALTIKRNGIASAGIPIANFISVLDFNCRIAKQAKVIYLEMKKLLHFILRLLTLIVSFV